MPQNSMDSLLIKGGTGKYNKFLYSFTDANDCNFRQQQCDISQLN